MAVRASEHITTRTKSGPDGVHVELTAGELEKAGIHPGEDVLLQVRRYTAEDWIRDNEGRVYNSEEEFDAAMEELCALPKE